MADDLEARYQKIMAGFTANERQRLPLDYIVYGETLDSLVAAMDEHTTAVDPIDLTPLYNLVKELQFDLGQQLEAAKLKDRIWSKSKDLELEILRDELAVLSAATHRRILDEYFFLTNVLELMGILREALTARTVEDSFIATKELLEAVQLKLIGVFQEIDEQYEKVQQWVFHQQPLTG